MKRIVQIVPRLPRVEGGVGGLRPRPRPASAEGFSIETRFIEADDATLLDLTAGETVLLHYANYAYQRRGCPARLVAGLEAWRRSGGGRLVTVFHEVYAEGPPWRSSSGSAPGSAAWRPGSPGRATGSSERSESIPALSGGSSPTRRSRSPRSFRPWESRRRSPPFGIGRRR